MKGWLKAVGDLPPLPHLTSPRRNEPLPLQLSRLYTDLYHSTAPMEWVLCNTSSSTSRPQLWEGSSQDTLYPQHSVSSHFLQLTFIRVQIWVSRLWVEVRICISSKLPVTHQQGLSTQTCWLNKNCSWNLDLQSTLLLCFLVFKKGLHITCHWVLRQGEKHSGENPPWPNPLSSVEMPSIVESEWRASPDPLDGHK